MGLSQKVFEHQGSFAKRDAARYVTPVLTWRLVKCLSKEGSEIFFFLPWAIQASQEQASGENKEKGWKSMSVEVLKKMGTRHANSDWQGLH